MLAMDMLAHLWCQSSLDFSQGKKPCMAPFCWSSVTSLLTLAVRQQFPIGCHCLNHQPLGTQAVFYLVLMKKLPLWL
ncbi:rCG41383 [Rattus norvegicus]|uniref:RCG41383 n=1 Tax=Rattus norvegicus TaxID=10116 RepID=A6IHV5_RAT|nr:rCG41383 [Rattus norvegicus]